MQVCRGNETNPHAAMDPTQHAASGKVQLVRRQEAEKVRAPPLKLLVLLLNR
jgi:hypothetical protein